MMDSIVLAYHATKPLLITELRTTSTIVEQALVERIKAEGEQWLHQAGSCLFKLRDGAGGYYCVQNNSSMGCTVTLNLQGSEGVIMTRGAEITEDTIPPKKSMLLNCATGLGGCRWSLHAEAKHICREWNMRFSDESHTPGIYENGFHDVF